MIFYKYHGLKLIKKSTKIKFSKAIANKKQTIYFNFSKKVYKILDKINKKLKEDLLQMKNKIIKKTNITKMIYLL